MMPIFGIGAALASGASAVAGKLGLASGISRFAHSILGKYLIGESIKGGTGVMSQIITNRANRKMAERTYQKDLALMKYQQEYDSPVQQMRRLKNAGLSPMLVYGSGNVTGNLTQNLPKYREPEKFYNFQVGSGSEFMDTLSKHQELKTKKATEDKLRADVESTVEATRLKKLMQDVAGIDIDLKKFNLGQLRELSKYVLEIKKHEAGLLENEYSNIPLKKQKLEEEIKNLKADKNYKYVQTMLEKHKSELRSLGIETTDPGIIRYFLRNVDRFKHTPRAFNSILTGLNYLLEYNKMRIPKFTPE